MVSPGQQNTNLTKPMATPSSLPLADKRALITGGSSGLGLEIAARYIRAGATVVITGRREDLLRQVCADMGSKASYIVNDVADLGGLPGLVDTVETRFGPIDILVNNAGINLKKPTLEVTDDEFETVLRTNLSSVFALTREVGKRMSERGRGAVIMVTSMASIYGIPNVAAYTASKSGLLGLTRSLAVDLSPKGIRVNAIAPGFIDTPMSRKAFETDPTRKQRVLARTPLNTLGSPADVAEAAVFLASEAACFITGVNLPVDGGNSIGF